MARRKTSERKRASAAGEGWTSIKVCANLDEDVVVEAVAKLLWAVRKSRGTMGEDNTSSGESNRK